MLTIIAAIGKNNALGKDNQLLWHLPLDFARFKALTTGHCIIMGRKTFDSLPKRLPQRQHLIVTRQKDFVAEGCYVFSSIEKAIEEALKQDPNPYIIGGGEIYKQSLLYADKIELTRVEAQCEADTFFPEIDETIWERVFYEFHQKDEKHAFNFSFETYVRKGVSQ